LEERFGKRVWLKVAGVVEPTKCSKCGVVIKLGTDCYTQSGDEYSCEDCGAKEMAKSLRRTKG
jgi:predicted RNA-binding Zn-ribbon protein involved in translation (DUF1610 family)